jgi:hypothetical protein
MERSGEVVSREELRQSLWSADTFVDFDHSLNTIINKLRKVLGDSGSSPRFIETLASVATVFCPRGSDHQPSSEGWPGRCHPAAPDRPVKDHMPSTSLLTRPKDLPPIPHGYVRVLFLLIQVV